MLARAAQLAPKNRWTDCWCWLDSLPLSSRSCSSRWLPMQESNSSSCRWSRDCWATCHSCCQRLGRTENALRAGTCVLKKVTVATWYERTTESAKRSHYVSLFFHTAHCGMTRNLWTCLLVVVEGLFFNVYKIAEIWCFKLLMNRIFSVAEWSSGS